jgi:peroxiredoxin
VEVPHLEALYKKYSDQGLVILGASVDQDYESLRQVVQREISYPVLRDSQGDASILYGVRGIPANFYIDRLGKVSKVEVGFHGELALENNIKDIL